MPLTKALVQSEMQIAKIWIWLFKSILYLQIVSPLQSNNDMLLFYISR